MNRCEQTRAQVIFYLDDELEGGERAALESHISHCADCRRVLQAERDFLEAIRDCRPLYIASAELRSGVEKALAAAGPPLQAPASLRRRVRRSLWRPTPSAQRLNGSRRAAASTVVAALAAAALLWGVGQKNQWPDPPLDFAHMAIDTHQRYLRGQLPLAIATGSPEKISAWFSGKVSFSFELPNYQESSGQEKLYELEGAGLVGYGSQNAAYVAYNMSQRPISLLVASDTVARPSGGEEIPWKGLKFHYVSAGGVEVITWSDRGLTYALVSDVDKHGKQSCIVCHEGTKDREFIEGFKPR
jgi:anti-sigma factor RsiW